ncbi:MAG: hypothetical protein IJX30_07880 [Clostridia bacterium]|nr:hypothetical protein [Clostridia bacterium]
MNKQQQKAKAIELMEQLDIYEAYIQSFEENDQVCFFEDFAGFWADQEPEVFAKMKAVEKEFGCTVYAITHELTYFGECYSFLFVSKYKEDWRTLVNSNKNVHHCFAYVWNKTDDWCSELGTITVKSAGGGIKRIA